MSLGLSHSLSRHKLKFSPDKVDTMIVQAIALLDDLDKELNTYAMRVKEWYGWHFPEMGRILNDNLAYARVILALGMRTNAAKADLAEILPEEIEGAVKGAAEVSMGTEITTEDLDNIQALAEQVISFTEYRAQLSGYLSARMAAIAPNLTALVGELVGARLIAHAGSLMNLAKSPASTIQILGAEKALFRALKTKHDTPKYGLIYHASLIGQATGKNKGKIARMLATKAAMGLRVDALSEWSQEGEGKGDLVTEEERAANGVANRLKLERRLASLEGRPLRSKGVLVAPSGASFTPGKWEVKEARKYNADADGLAGDEPAAAALVTQDPNGLKLIEDVSEEFARKKPKRSKADKAKGIEPIKKAVEDAVDEEMESSDDEAKRISDVEMEDQPEAPATLSPVHAVKEASDIKKTNSTGDDSKSETISTVSVDSSDSLPSPTQQEVNPQSSIPRRYKTTEKARKKEKHLRTPALSEETSRLEKLKKEKIARRLDRKERRQKRAEQVERREERGDDKFGALAKKAGLTISRYQRKLERGEIKFEADGTPVAVSKKDVKKARKAAEKAAAADAMNGDISSRKKRKRDEEAAEKSEKRKKKKHHKVLA